MEHIFTPEEEQTALDILKSIETAHEAGSILLGYIISEKDGEYFELATLLDNLLLSVQNASLPFRRKLKSIWLPVTCQSARASLQKIQYLKSVDIKKCAEKIKYELLPIFEEAYMQFYFWAYVYSHPDREEKYYAEEIYELSSNQYTNQALETGKFKYEVAFSVLAYNNLSYTKRCVESLLENIPKDLNYELILWDNGSSDGTLDYFESKNPTKIIESRINWSIGNATTRIIEAKYRFNISNDVIIMPGAIENLLDCIRSDEKVAWVVPTTPNVSNLQSIPGRYSNMEELYEFSKNNNLCNPFRREERVRLCNPIDVINMKLFYSREGICADGYLTGSVFAFPDDRQSLLVRRAGYKQLLVKDAYCYHFGSATLKNEIQRQGEQQRYLEGRKEFYRAFNVDPWGTGFCYDTVFLNRVVGEECGHTEILGINCGLGSNSLKIKEQIKEYCHNLDTCLSNITDDSSFIMDLKGISDMAQTVTTIKELKKFLNGRVYQYIVWETPFLLKYKFKTILETCVDALAPGGKLIIKLTDQSREAIARNFPEREELGNDWVICQRGEQV